MEDIVVQAMPADEGIMLAEISNTSVDMSGDVMLPQGCDASLWQDSGTFLDEHDVAKTLGRGLDILRTENAVVVKVQFALNADPASSLYKRASDAWAEYKTGARNKFSIGFIPLEVSTKPHVCEKYGPNCKRVISKWLLLEASCVTLPDNFATKVIDMKALGELYGEKLTKKSIDGKEVTYKTIDCTIKKDLAEDVVAAVEEVMAVATDVLTTAVTEAVSQAEQGENTPAVELVTEPEAVKEEPEPIIETKALPKPLPVYKSKVNVLEAEIKRKRGKICLK